MKPSIDVGIVGWGVYIPRYRIKVASIAKFWGYAVEAAEGLGVIEKAVAGPDEDSATMGCEASRNAIARGMIDPRDIGAVYFGTESKPYSVKPTATIVAEALGITPKTLAADLEFACRAGSEGIEACMGLVSSGMIRYGLAIGADTAQAAPGDVLEFTASSGAAAYIIGRRGDGTIAYFEGSYAYVTDTPDFWRRQLIPYPAHGEAFTGEPAYFRHIVGAVRGLMDELGLKPSDFDYAVFHQPNAKFPLKVARKLGIPKEKVLPSLMVKYIGNTYNGSALIGLAAILEKAKPGDRILLAPFGSGAGSDAFSIIVEEGIEERVKLAPTVEDYLNRKTYIDYGLYTKFRGKIRRLEAYGYDT